MLPRIRNIHLGLAVAGMVLVPQANAQVDPNFYVFLAFGQSNMEGNAALPSPAMASNARFQDLSAVTCGSRTQGKWFTAQSPLVRCDSKYSLLESFGKTMMAELPATIKIGIVPVAVAGTAITGFDPTQAKSYYSSQQSWMQSIANQYGGEPYARLVAMAKVAQQTGVIKGILLHQGETDAGQAGWADKVKTIYNKLLSDLSLKAADVPLLAGEVYNNAGTNAGINKLPGVVPTAYVVSSSGCAAGSDNLHFSVAGYDALGARYAQKMIPLLPKSSLEGRKPVSDKVTGGDYSVYDLKGVQVASFHAADAASVESSWNGVRQNLPSGIYWMKNAASGVPHRVLNER